MAYQTSVDSSNGATESERRSMSRSVADLLHDLLVLGELQYQLFLTDARAAINRTMLPLILATVGLFILAGSFPVALAGIAYLLVAAGLTLWGALLIAAAIGLVCSVLLFGGAYLLIKRSFNVFHRSSDELKCNMIWIKNVLKHSGRGTHSPSGPIR